MTDNSHSHPLAVQKFGPNNCFLGVNTRYLRGYSFMLLLVSADSSKVFKKSIRVSNGLVPDQN